MAKSPPSGRPVTRATNIRPTLRGQAPVQKRRSPLPIILSVLALVVLGGLAWLASRTSPTATNVAISERAVEPYATDATAERNHVQTTVQYKTNPPVGGDHSGSTATWGVQTSAPPDEMVVHNMEHGGVIIWYDPAKVDAGTVDKLRKLTRSLQPNNFRVLLTPRTKGIDLGKPLAVTAWGYLMTLDKYDEAAIRTFYTKHINRGPECQTSNNETQCPQ